MVTRRGGHFYVVVNGATKEGDIEYMTERLPRGIVIDHMKEQALLALQGPKAVEALSRLVPGVEELGFMTGGVFSLGGTNVWISRSGYTGEDGFEISLPGSRAVGIADLIASQPEVKPIGLGARDSLRLEAGLPLYGHDLDRGTTPIEADLELRHLQAPPDARRVRRLEPDRDGAGARAAPPPRRPVGRGPPAGARRRNRGRRRRQ